MLKNIWMFGRRGNPFRKLIIGNQAALSFLLPKFVFLSGIVVLLLARLSAWSSSIALVLGAIELGLALVEVQRLVNEGARRGRPLRCAGSHLVLSLGWLVVAWAMFEFLPLWLALPATLVWLVSGLVGLVALNLWLLILDMRAAPASATAELFQQVREMHDLDRLTAQLEALVLAAKEKNARRDAQFYLGWAETFRGHAALGRGEWSADEFYQRALHADPCNLAARSMLAIVQARHGDFELALNETHQAVAILRGEMRHDPVIWSLHQNETGSEYEQNAGLFQLCTLLIGMIRNSQESGATKELLEKELSDLAAKIPERSKTELYKLLHKKAGRHLGALAVLTAGPYRPPASPLDLLRPALILPSGNSEYDEEKESAA